MRQTIMLVDIVSIPSSRKYTLIVEALKDDLYH